MKYIMFQNKKTGRKVPFIFPDQFVHKDMADLLIEIFPNDSVGIISAGEIKLTVHNCSGKSSTLGVGVVKGDAKIIHDYDYFHGYPNELGIVVDYKSESEAN